MSVGLFFQVLKLSLEIFKDERKDRFLRKTIKLEKEWNEEYSKPDSSRSDLALDRILFDIENLSRAVLSEQNK